MCFQFLKSSKSSTEEGEIPVARVLAGILGKGLEVETSVASMTLLMLTESGAVYGVWCRTCDENPLLPLLSPPHESGMKENYHLRLKGRLVTTQNKYYLKN